MVKNLIRKIKQTVYLREVALIIWKQGALLSIASIISIICEYVLFFSTLYFTKELLNQISTQVFQTPAANLFLANSFLIALGAALLYALFRVLTTHAIELLGLRLNLSIEQKIHDKLVRLDYSKFENSSLFDKIYRARQSGADRPNLLFLNAIEILKQLFSLLAIAVFTAGIDYLLIPMVVVFVMPILWVKMQFAQKMMLLHHLRSPKERKANYFSHLLANTNAAKEIRLFSTGSYFKNKYLNLLDEIRLEKQNYNKKKNLAELIVTLFSVLGIYGVIAYLVGQAKSGNVEAGELVIIIALVPQAFSYLQSLAIQFSYFYQNNVKMGYIFELLNLPEAPKSPNNLNIEKVAVSKLELKDIWYHYPNSGQEILKGINLTIEKGKVIALVGLNGAGKSTLVSIILGLLKPSKGTILLNGVDVTTLDEASYLQYFSGVLQDFVNYNGRLGENIGFEDERKVAYFLEHFHAIDINDLLKKFDNGLETVLGKTFEGGKELSKGEWQKIAIARALFKPSDFLILDEASSAMDVQAEKNFLQVLKHSYNDRGILIISHRRSAIEHADYVYVLASGVVVESGIPQELLKKSSVLSKLFLED